MQLKATPSEKTRQDEEGGAQRFPRVEELQETLPHLLLHPPSVY